MSEKEKQAIESLNKSTEKLTPAQMQRLSDIAYSPGASVAAGIASYSRPPRGTSPRPRPSSTSCRWSTEAR